jgi:heptose I phosphotransferase
VLQGLRAQTRRLLARRHVREKRQPPGADQSWVCVDGEALCVTPVLKELCPDRVPAWLPLDRQPSPAPGAVSRRWLPLAGGRTLLVRRRGRAVAAVLWAWLSGRPLLPPEQRQAALLLRLERHAVPGPRVLALGQRRDWVGRFDSFLLTRPPDDAVALEAWLRQGRRLTGKREVTLRRNVLRQAGALLRRLHDATCYLDGGGGCGLAVQLPPGGKPAVVLGSGEGVAARRRRSPGRERRDFFRVQRALAQAGCGRTDLGRFRAGYRQAVPVTAGRPAAARPTEDTDRSRPPPPGRPADPTPAAPDSPGPGPGRETLWHRLFRGVRRLRQRADWALFAGRDWPDRILDVAVTDRFHAKQGRSTGRWVLPPGRPGGRGLTVYLKRHYRLPWWQGLLATLWPQGGWSPAVREWQHLQWARRQGVPVPEVVAAAEYIGPWGRLRSFLAVEELADMLPLPEALPLAAARLDPRAFRRWKRTLAAEMARLARMLHDRRCFHKDLYLCHFYVARGDAARLPPGEGWRGRVCLIDLHRLAHHPWTWRLWQLKDLAQLLYSSEIPGIDARDRLWFWHAYCGTGPRRGADRWLRRGVWLKWQRYRRHNARHKTKDEG